MKSTFLLVLLLTAFVCQAQTKIIAHKSHSGSKHSFTKAYQQNLFNINSSNFGLPSKENIVVLDTVIALNESTTILKIRESIIKYHEGTNYKTLTKAHFKFRTDTLVNDKIFRKNNTLDFIKSSERYPIIFHNLIEEVIFIGFKKY